MGFVSLKILIESHLGKIRISDNYASEVKKERETRISYNQEIAI